MAALKPFVEHLENELTCSICQDIFTDPKTLPCLHSYCTKCIAQWYERSGNQLTNRLNCPLCKARIDVPDGDPFKLRSSFYLDSLLQLFNSMKSTSNQQELPTCASCEKSVVVLAFCPQCSGFICDDCVNAHKAIKQVREEHKPTMLNEFKQENVAGFIKNQMMCKEKFHEKNKLEYYCQEESCRRCICQKCFALSHRNHQMQSLEEAAEEAKQAIQQHIDRVNLLREKYEDESKQSKQNMQRIQKEIDLAKNEVRQVEELMHKMVRDHSRAMIDALDQILHDQTTANDEEQSDINTKVEQVSELSNQWQKISSIGTPHEMIESKKDLEEICQALSEIPSILSSKRIQRDMTVHYETNHQIMQSFQDLGKIVKIMPDPSKSTIESLNEGFCGSANTFNIITRNTEGQVCHTRIESIDLKIKDVEGNEVEKKLFDEQNGKYRVSYKAKKAGPYEIQVNIGGEPIKNSPQNVNTLDVKTKFKPVKTFGGKGHGKGQLNTPKSIALSDNGEIAVADWGNNRIQIFSLDGKHLREFGNKGSRKDTLLRPFGVVFDEDRIVVSDRPDGVGRIQEFDSNGTYVRTIYRPYQQFLPRRMCVSDNHTIALCCKGAKIPNIQSGTKPSIKMFNEHRDLTKEVSMNKYEKPAFITYSNGKYFVTYSKQNYVDAIDENGHLLYKFGEPGTREGQFNFARGLAVYGPDMILVCDRDNHRVQLFTQEGQFISSFGSYGSGVGQMICPIDVVVSSDGQVIVLEMDGNLKIWA